MQNVDQIHHIYLPFTSAQLRHHFAPVRGRTLDQLDKRVGYYTNSAREYSDFCLQNPNRQGFSITTSKSACQIEKDERFWSAACWMGLFYAPDRTQRLAAVMMRCFGATSPIPDLESWEECFNGKLHLFFEASLPSPRVYKNWLAARIRERHLIPYVHAAAARGGYNFEGGTHVDVLLVNEDNGFSLLVEAKVVSDVSGDVSFDLLRNQLARCIDVALEQNTAVLFPLSLRRPERTLVLLQSPELFRRNPHTRLYGWLFHSYKDDPNTLAKEMPYREHIDWNAVSSRLGWLTWEDCRSVLPTSCPWISGDPGGVTEA